MELRAKVAELCGWKHAGWNGSGRWEKDGVRTIHYPPHYQNDLNACAEFEKGLTDEQCQQYHLALESVQAEMTKERDGREDYPAQGFWFHATAEQRCLAFIATVKAPSDPSGNVSDNATGVSSQEFNCPPLEEKRGGQIPSMTHEKQCSRAVPLAGGNFP